MKGASAQNGNNHEMIITAPTRRRVGDRLADSVSPVVGFPCRMRITDFC
jgi:hypothetical protein